MSKKVTLFGGTPEFQGGASYEWGNQAHQNSLGPVVDIIGTGSGWAKETHGPVKITGDGTRTVVRVTGPGGWKITGPETITG